jgi:hypothetical protein
MNTPKAIHGSPWLSIVTRLARVLGLRPAALPRGIY